MSETRVLLNPRVLPPVACARAATVPDERGGGGQDASRRDFPYWQATVSWTYDRQIWPPTMLVNANVFVPPETHPGNPLP